MHATLANVPRGATEAGRLGAEKTRTDTERADQPFQGPAPVRSDSLAHRPPLYSRDTGTDAVCKADGRTEPETALALPCSRSHKSDRTTGFSLGIPDLPLDVCQANPVPQRGLGQRVVAVPTELAARFGITLAVPVAPDGRPTASPTPAYPNQAIGAAWRSRPGNSVPGSRTAVPPQAGTYRPSRVIAIRHHAITLLIGVARCSRSAVRNASRSTQQPDFNSGGRL